MSGLPTALSLQLEWVACFLLQGIFPSQGSNPGLERADLTVAYQGGTRREQVPPQGTHKTMSLSSSAELKPQKMADVNYLMSILHSKEVHSVMNKGEKIL